MENKLVKISLLTMIISIVLVLIAIFVFVKPVFALALAILYLSNAQSILLLLSGVMIVSGAVYITYRYLLYIINYSKTKKVKTILMVVIPIVLLTILGIIYRKEETGPRTRSQGKSRRGGKKGTRSPRKSRSP